MNIKEAKKIIVSLSKPDKMPGFAYGIPAAECKTGAKLRLIPNSVCAGCYALKGNYARFPAIVQAQYKRLESIQGPALGGGHGRGDKLTSREQTQSF